MMSAFHLGLMQNNENRYQNIIKSILLLISAFIILHKSSNSKKHDLTDTKKTVIHE